MIVQFWGTVTLMVVLLVIAAISYLSGKTAVAATSVVAAVLFFLLLLVSTPQPGNEKGVVISSTPQVLIVDVKGFPLAVTPLEDETLERADKVKLEKQDDGQWLVTEWTRTKKYK